MCIMHQVASLWGGWRPGRNLMQKSLLVPGRQAKSQKRGRRFASQLVSSSSAEPGPEGPDSWRAALIGAPSPRSMTMGSLFVQSWDPTPSTQTPTAKVPQAIAGRTGADSCTCREIQVTRPVGPQSKDTKLGTEQQPLSGLLQNPDGDR